MSDFTPTPEQDTAIGRFLSGSDLVVQAGAGAGKTATLKLMAEADPSRSGQYIAFNRSIVEEAGRKMPRNISARTSHSLAFTAVGKPLAHKLQSKRMPSGQVAALLGIREPVKIQIGQAAKWLAPGWLAGHVMRSIERFCNSADPTPDRRHVPYIEGLDLPDAAGRRTYQNNDLIAQAIAPTLGKAWADLIDPAGQLRYSHSVYLKLWELSGPVINADFILFDEAQDVAPVQASIVAQQADRCQRVYVGDSQQCQPPGTLVQRVTGRGRDPELVPIEHIKAGDRVVSWSSSAGHRYAAGHLVLETAERGFAGRLVVAKSQFGESLYTPSHRCIANPVGLADKYVVYVMRRGDQFRVGCCRWQYLSQHGAAGPVVRARQEGADAVWPLEAFDSKPAALVYEFGMAGRYGLPTITFAPVNSGSVLGAKQLEAGWALIGSNLDRAAALLGDHDRSLAHPMWSRGEQQFKARRPGEIAAANLMTGMLVTDGQDWAPVTVGRRDYLGMVHSLRVDGPATYIADGMVTHNSIYAWRGAEDALNQLAGQDGVEQTFLTKSFRFGPAIADMANACLALIPSADLRVTGYDQVESVVTTVDNPDAFLCRTNARAMRAFLDCIATDRKAHLVGGGKELASFARAWIELRDKGWTAHPELSCFDTPAQVEDYCDTDPQGSELALLVQLVTEHTPETLLEALDNQVPEHAADEVISTSHKAKGREWASVALADDFPDPDERDVSDEEMRLLYVSVTRAQNALDVSAVPLLRKLPASQETAV